MSFRAVIKSIVLTFFLTTISLQPLLAAEPDTFPAWLAEFKTEAAQQGISARVLEQAFKDVSLLPRVIELDRKQPELTQTLSQYLQARVTSARIERGRKMLKRYPTWLGRIEEQYQVPRQYIVALWGIETNYGRYTGSFPIISSLTTLAYDGRRSSYFRKELHNVLWLLEQKHIKVDLLQGSWAGAMGQCQFMPSSFRNFAVNADGGYTDIWTSIPDVFASAANYLKQSGWQAGQSWGQQVQIPDNFDSSLAGLNKPLPVARWRELGVTAVNHQNYPDPQQQGSLLIDPAGGPAYLVYDNFHVLLKWNRSTAFAIAVGSIADRLHGK